MIGQDYQKGEETELFPPRAGTGHPLERLVLEEVGEEARAWGGGNVFTVQQQVVFVHGVRNHTYGLLTDSQ